MIVDLQAKVEALEALNGLGDQQDVLEWVRRAEESIRVSGHPLQVYRPRWRWFTTATTLLRYMRWIRSSRHWRLSIAGTIRLSSAIHASWTERVGETVLWQVRGWVDTLTLCCLVWSCCCCSGHCWVVSMHSFVNCSCWLCDLFCSVWALDRGLWIWGGKQLLVFLLY